MADRGADVLARAAGIDLLLQTEPELARALERSCSPSSEGSTATPFGDDEYMLAVELRPGELQFIPGINTEGPIAAGGSDAQRAAIAHARGHFPSVPRRRGKESSSGAGLSPCERSLPRS